MLSGCMYYYMNKCHAETTCSCCMAAWLLIMISLCVILLIMYYIHDCDIIKIWWLRTSVQWLHAAILCMYVPICVTEIVFSVLFYIYYELYKLFIHFSYMPSCMCSLRIPKLAIIIIIMLTGWGEGYSCQWCWFRLHKLCMWCKLGAVSRCSCMRCSTSHRKY